LVWGWRELKNLFLSFQERKMFMKKKEDVSSTTARIHISPSAIEAIAEDGTPM